jgi:hypothetical protein
MKKRTKIEIGIGLLMAGIICLLGNYDVTALLALGATVPFLGNVTEDEKKKQEELLKTIQDKVKEVVAESQKENVKASDLETKIKELNDLQKDLSEEAKKELKTKLDEMAAKNDALVEDVKKANDALKTQSEEIKKLKEQGMPQNDAKKGTLREAIKSAIMKYQDKVLTEKDDADGKRFSMKEYFEHGNKTSPSFKIEHSDPDKAVVDMLESNIVQSNVATVRLTELDPMRVGIPLTIYPHVMDVMKVKNIRRPNMSLLVAYTYEDGAGTKTEGSASTKSSFLFKTVEFKSFYIATHFVLSDETLDDLDEALDEISIVAPDKILDQIDSKILSASGDDSTDIAGLFTANKMTAYANPFTDIIEGANITDVIMAAKLQAENNKQRPNTVYMSPNDVYLLSAAKNTFEDSKTDRRVVYDVIGNPVSACGLRIIISTEVAQGELVVFDNRQTWIGRRREMTMEIGYNGSDLTEGQKTVVLKIRVAFGVRDKAAVIYVSDIPAAIVGLQTT